MHQLITGIVIGRPPARRRAVVPVVAAITPGWQIGVHAFGAPGVLPGVNEADVLMIDIEPVEAAGGGIEYFAKALLVEYIVACCAQERQRGVQLSEIGAALAGQ